MIRIFVVFILCFLCFSCTEISDRDERSSGREKEAVVNEILEKVANQIKDEYQLGPFGSGGQMMSQVEMLHLAFVYRKPLTVEEGRRLVLAAMHKFLDGINKEIRIHPYLANYPFSPENIEIEIFVQNQKGLPFDSSDVEIVCCRKGNCIYKKVDRIKNQSILILKETVAEAELKVKQQ